MADAPAPAPSAPAFNTERSPGPKVPSAPGREVNANTLPPISRTPTNTPGRQARLAKFSTVAGVEPPAPAGAPPLATPATDPPRPGADAPPRDEPNSPDHDVPHGTEPLGDTAPVPANGTPVPADKVDKRQNPWKLRDQERQGRIAAENRVRELESQRVPDQERTALTERVTKAEARAKELEDHIRYVDYEKSTEFAEKYNQPYVKAWKEAIGELSEVSIPDPETQQMRAVTDHDLLALVNLPLGEAQRMATERFGEFASVAMQHRKAIKDRAKQREEALAEAKTKGGERIKQQKEAAQQAQNQTWQRVTQLAAEVHKEIMADHKLAEDFLMKPIPEGKEPTPEESEWNEAMRKGFEHYDKYSKVHPANAKTDEERRDIIAGQLLIAQRCAAYGAVKRQRNRLLKRVASLEKDLAQYQQNTPTTGGQPRAGGPAPTLTPRQAREQRFQRAAGL
jgi:hypothetical protein